MRAPKSVAALVGAGLIFTGAVSANAMLSSLDGTPPPKQPGFAVALTTARGLEAVRVAQGSMPLDGGTAANPYYGYDGNGPMLPAPGDLPAAGHLVEATKTEPDKNTYLVLSGQTGPTAGYDYGTHFLFQGHELGSPGFLSRINLDADGAHRVTLMASQDVNGNPLPDYDGSTWDPFARKLLLTTESTAGPSVYQATTDYPSQVTPLDGVFGRAGYEGVQVDRNGAIWLVEDQGGVKGTVNTNAKQPNSFVFRFTPKDPSDLSKGGLLQALQVTSLETADPIVFHPGQADQDITSADEADLHSYGNTFQTSWVTVHDTSADGFGSFNANTNAKAAGATPFKRPENGIFQPGTGFTSFVFTETGDTDATSQAGAALGGYGALYVLHQGSPGSGHGTLSMLYRGDEQHTGFDNIAFSSQNTVLVAEDAGDTLHTQRNAFDSLYAFDLNADYGAGGAPQRLVYVGRDASATIDSALGAYSGFQNEGDNEVTGVHVSNGDPSIKGLLGAAVPHPFTSGSPWRVFFTAQHGDNVTYQLRSAG
jgi:uncharacterized protein DUF839